jgi:N-acetylmuramoyl-L-alanine amidase
VELGFGSNADEARFLTGVTGQRRLARALVDAVQGYLAGYERRVGSPDEGRR